MAATVIQTSDVLDTSQRSTNWGAIHLLVRGDHYIAFLFAGLYMIINTLTNSIKVC